MKAQCWLVLEAKENFYGDITSVNVVKMTRRNRPESLGPNQVAVKVEADVPVGLFAPLVSAPVVIQ